LVEKGGGYGETNARTTQGNCYQGVKGCSGSTPKESKKPEAALKLTPERRKEIAGSRTK
jgi:hypothetical protein